jgi:uncharacterized protein YgiM (DUF1202 family)
MKPILVLLFLLVVAAAWAGPPAVQVKEASVYAKPSSLGKLVGKVPYGTVLTVLATQGGWAQVRVDSASLTGWVRTQSFTTKDLDLQAGSQVSGVSSTEVSLAGRGFTEEIEQDYKTKNPQLDFADMDKMEGYGLPDDQLTAFLTNGGLVPGGDE